MRKRIISKLAKAYKKSEQEVINIIHNDQVIPTFKFHSIDNRDVIKKDLLEENTLINLDYYKSLLNSMNKIKYPNRSFIMTGLMNIMPDLHKFHNYTIYKFDFKSFFNNVDIKKACEFIEFNKLRPEEASYLNKYAKKVKNLTPGLGLHNALIEIGGKHFDTAIKNKFNEEGLLFYSRYVDDCIVILDEKVEKEYLDKKILETMKIYFGKKLLLNEDKCEYYTSEDKKYELNYLGYCFVKGQSVSSPFKFGISKSKIKKYEAKLERIILDYKIGGDLQKLELMLEIFYKRLVYYGTKKNNHLVKWQVRGISDSYKELKRFMKHNQDFSKITPETEKLFCKSIYIIFNKHRISIPTSIKNYIDNHMYPSLYYKNNAILLHPKIGLKFKGLQRKIEVLSSDNFENHSYNDLAKEFLKKITI